MGIQWKLKYSVSNRSWCFFKVKKVTVLTWSNKIRPPADTRFPFLVTLVYSLYSALSVWVIFVFWMWLWQQWVNVNDPKVCFFFPYDDIDPPGWCIVGNIFETYSSGDHKRQLAGSGGELCAALVQHLSGFWHNYWQSKLRVGPTYAVSGLNSSSTPSGIHGDT